MLTGHVIGSVIQTMLAIAIVMRRRGAHRLPLRRPGPLEWLAAAGLLVAHRARHHVAVRRLGMVPDSVETASNLPMFLILLPFLSSGFVPTALDARRPALVRRAPAVHADHRDRAWPPLGTPIGNSGVLAVGWCVGISVVGYLWARRLYDRDPASAI